MSVADPSPPPTTAGTRAAAELEEVARSSYGRLVAYLAGIAGDVAAAEDALGDALEAALRRWPTTGVPARPESWLLTVARRTLVDAARRRSVARRNLPALTRLVEVSMNSEEGDRLPDRRLELMFACTHPAIDVAVRSPLMLQVVLGLDAARVGAAFLVPGPTMGQRLVRAKTKIRAAGIPFTVPGRDELPGRLGAVLDALYAAYGSSWDEPEFPSERALAGEARRLAGLVAELLPGEPEAAGLVALLDHSRARAGARRSTEGAFVPLAEQDVRRWDPVLLTAAEQQLQRALDLGGAGRYVLHAAIQSQHNRRAVTGSTDWATVLALYDRLADLTPTVGVAVARAAAARQHLGAAPAKRLLDAVPASLTRDYQPYWAVRAFVLRDLGDPLQAAAAARAVAASTDEAVRSYLRRELGG